MTLPPPRRPPPRKPKPGAFRLHPQPPPPDPNDPILCSPIFDGPRTSPDPSRSPSTTSSPSRLNVIEWLEAKRIEREPWILAARRILKGEFDKHSKSVLQAAYVGMRKSKQPECVAAVQRLMDHKDFTRVAQFVFKPDDERR